MIFTAGGSGSGKSETFLPVLKQNSLNSIIFDGTMAEYDSAMRKIAQAIEYGKEVKLGALYIDIEEAWRFAKTRERSVDKIFAEKHFKFRETMYRIAKENPNVKFDVRVNNIAENKLDDQNFSTREELLEYLDGERFSSIEEVIDRIKD